MASIILATLLLASSVGLEGNALPCCSPSYPKDCQINSFKLNTYFTSPLNFDAVPGKIVAGAKDALYLLTSNLTLVKKLSTLGPACGLQVCPNNLVRLYSAPSAKSSTLVVCGSAGPQCSLVDANTMQTLSSSIAKMSSTLLASDPNIPSVGIFFNVTTARKTNFFAASGTSLTFHTFNTSDPTSLGTSLKFGINSTYNTFNRTTWFSSLLVIVDVYKADYPMRGFIPPGLPDNRNPDEHKYLFVFVREQDPTTLVITNKIVRLCQNDPGSVSKPNGLPFPTTLLKANISCQSASGPLRPNLLEGVVFSRPGRYYPGGEWVELMYGTFTDYTGYSPQTSICVYSAKDSDYSLASGANNKGVFDIFRSQVYDPVSGRNIANSYVECSPNGRTDLSAQRIKLTQAITQYSPEPLVILPDVVITKMVVDQPCVFNGSSCIVQDVLFLGTSTGSLLKMTMSISNGLIVPTISVPFKLPGDSSSVRQLQIKQYDGVKYLYVSTDNGIYKLPLESCNHYQSCSDCMASKDPYCVWDSSISQCVKFTGVSSKAMISFQKNCNNLSNSSTARQTESCNELKDQETTANNSFTSNNYFVSPLNFDAVPGKIVVGAQDKLYLLSENLTLEQELNISGLSCGPQACPNNLVRLYSAPSANSDTLVVCGSAGPQCSLLKKSLRGHFTSSTEKFLSSSTLLTSDPKIPSVGIFFNVSTSRKTNFFAASGTSLTFHTLNTSDPTSLGTSLKFGINSTYNAFNRTTWFSSLLVIVDVYKADYPMRGFIPPGLPDNRNPDEHKYLFVFVREQDFETSMVTNKVVRLCQNDPGSVSKPNGLPFPTTLLKANISCQSASGPLKQNLLQSVAFSRPGRYYPGGEWMELMYGTFTDYSGYSPQTSICVYRANDSDYSLASGANNKGVFDIFRSQVYDPVGGRNIANAFMECNSIGRSDLAAQRINLVQSIQQYNPNPLATLNDVVVTKMAVDQTCVLNGSSCITQDVLFLGTSEGSVLKMLMTIRNGSLTPVISETIKLSSTVRQMQIRNQTGVKYLYVNTDSGIYRLPLESCNQYLDCSGCVKDPYCMWNSSIKQCAKFVNTGNRDLSALSADQLCLPACNGTVVSGNEVHFSVPTNLQTNSLFGTESPPISLCYGVLGDDNKYFNLISNAGASVNAHYHKAANTAGDVANIIDQIAIKAVDVRGLTHNISVNLSCLAQINGADVERYDSDGIVVRRTTNQSVLVWVPNCSPSNYPLKIQITCQSPPLANTSGGLNLIVDERINANPKSHGIIGQFWNAAMTVFKYTGAMKENSSLKASEMYVVTISGSADSSDRSFAGSLSNCTWSSEKQLCLYVGDSQGNRMAEAVNLNGPVIEGTYIDYVTNGPFETNHRYNKFTSRCSL